MYIAHGTNLIQTLSTITPNRSSPNIRNPLMHAATAKYSLSGNIVGVNIYQALVGSYIIISGSSPFSRQVNYSSLIEVSKSYR